MCNGSNTIHNRKDSNTNKLMLNRSTILIVSCSSIAVTICVSCASVIKLVHCCYCSFLFMLCTAVLLSSFILLLLLLSFLCSLFQTALRCFTWAECLSEIAYLPRYLSSHKVKSVYTLASLDLILWDYRDMLLLLLHFCVWFVRLSTVFCDGFFIFVISFSLLFIT